MRSSSPLPRARVSLAGVPLAEDVGQSVTSIVLRQSFNLPTLCEITLTDPPSELAGEGFLQPDMEVGVLTAEGGPPSFDGHLAAIEQVFGGDEGRVLRLRAYDKLDQLRRNRRQRVLSEASLGDLAQVLARPAGLMVSGGEGVRIPSQLIQHRQSDLDLLVEWAGRSGHYLACEGDDLTLVRLEPGEPRVVLDRSGGGWQARFERTSVGAVDRTEAVGWDAGTLERRAGSWATSSDHPARTTLWRTNRVLRVSDDETEQARAETERRDAGRLVTWARGSGDPRLRVGSTVVVRGFGSAYETPQRVSGVEHAVDAEAGYTTTFTTDPPRLSAGREATEVSVARVADTRDPDGTGRVRVLLEAFGDVTSDWLPVMIAGAGPGKGLTIYPEVDDLVLVLLSGPDPSTGIVLGGLYGTEASADAEVSGRRPRPFSLRTPGGQRLRLDDAGALSRLENADGSYLEMTTKAVILHAARDLLIEVPGRSLTLAADSIDMRRA